jgi:hypothetical protein
MRTADRIRNRDRVSATLNRPARNLVWADAFEFDDPPFLTLEPPEFDGEEDDLGPRWQSDRDDD